MPLTYAVGVRVVGEVPLRVVAEGADEVATETSTKKSRPSASESDKDSMTTCVVCGVSVPLEQFFKHAILHRKRIVRKSTVCRVCNVSVAPEDFGAILSDRVCVYVHIARMIAERSCI